MARPQTDPQIERRNLAQKERLAYLLEQYAYDLSGFDLYRRLRLNDAFSSPVPGKHTTEEGFRESVERWLPDRLRIATNTANFAQWLITDSSNKNYRPNKGFNKRICEALAFAVADCSGVWPKISKTDETFDSVVQHIAGFIHDGAPQPAEIFYGLRRTAAREYQRSDFNTQARRDQCQRFLRGERPTIEVVNAGATIERKHEAEIIRLIQDDDRRFVLVTAAAGDGKTTLALRLVKEFFHRNWSVIYKFSYGPHSPFATAIGRNAKTLFIFDRAEALEDAENVHDWLASNPELRVLVLARDADWRRCGYTIEDPRHAHVFLDRLHEDEILELARLMASYQVSPEGLGHEAIADRLRQSVYNTQFPYMLAAVMTASTGYDFRHILQSMVDSFEPKQLLRLTALGSTTLGNEGRPIHCNTTVFRALLAGPDAAIEVGKARFDQVYPHIRSEIIPIGESQFDLRHPDIVRFTIETLYRSNVDGTLTNTTDLEEDLYAWMRALHRMAVLEAGTPSGQRRLLRMQLNSVPAFWWSSERVSPHVIGRSLFQGLVDLYGTLLPDQDLMANTLLKWMQLERSLNDHSDDEAISLQRQWLPKLTEIFRNTNRPKEVYSSYVERIRFASKHGTRGDFISPEPESIRALLREMWTQVEFRGTSLLRLWIEFDGSDESVGTIIEPKANTIRRHFHSFWAEKNVWADLLIIWAQFEIAQGHLGKIEAPDDFSARWLFRAALETTEDRANWRSPNLLLVWGQFEFENGVVGASLENPEEYSARDIFRKAWSERSSGLCNANLMTRWGELEAEKGIFGSLLNDPEEFSARDIFRKAWSERSSGLCNANLMTRWGELEAEKGIFGSLPNDPEELSACDDPEEFSARAIFRKAWSNRASGQCNGNLMVTWGELEAKHGILGSSISNPETCSARWIFREVWTHQSEFCSAEILRRWANIESDKGNIGSSPEAPEEFSARWIFRRAFELYPSDTDIRFFENWMMIEIAKKNFGSEEAAFSVRWLLKKRDEFGIKSEMDIETAIVEAEEQMRVERTQPSGF